VAAFVRRHKKDWVLIVVPRWLARGRYPTKFGQAGRFWGTTEVRLQATAPASWSNVLTGESVKTESAGGRRTLRMDKLLETFPVALLSGTTVSIRAKGSR